jgi:unsaturated rhamnogalacturonyl hydrolase
MKTSLLISSLCAVCLVNGACSSSDGGSPTPSAMAGSASSDAGGPSAGAPSGGVAIGGSPSSAGSSSGGANASAGTGTATSAGAGTGGTLGGAGGGSAGTNAMSGAAGMAGAGGTATAPAVDRAATLALMRKVADYYLASFGNTTVNDWIRSTFYTGLMAAYRATEDTKYRDASRSWAEANQWKPYTGDARFADNQCCAQTYAELYLDAMPGDPKMLAPISTVLDDMVANPKTGRVEWWWCDSLFMAPAALARFSKATGKTQYLELMHSMYWDTTDFLYNKPVGLFWRDKDYVGKDVYWARGNGWVFAGLPRIMEYLPAADAKKPNYEALFKEMAAALLKAQQADGFWRSDLLKPDRFPNPESSGTAFFTYGMAWGIHHGLLDRATYLPVALKGWNALTKTALNAQGKIGWVQVVASAPGAATEGDTRDYAAGAFLLAGSELIEL